MKRFCTSFLCMLPLLVSALLLSILSPMTASATDTRKAERNDYLVKVNSSTELDNIVR
ncbi:MAG: hypothetical protein HQK53_13820 [Oligoflexia bacterium]|nr:hypothetical protein [Oligoflexia bacterium]